MQKYKNFQLVHGVVLVLTLLVAGFFAGYGLLSAHKAFADTQCPNGFTYSAFYHTCLGPPINGTCPSGSTKSTQYPAPNVCTAQPSTATGSASGGGGSSGSGGSNSGSTPTFKASTQQPGAGQYVCGEGADAVHVSINFGCQGKGSALTDATFAIIRVLSAGVGLVIITSIVVAGIQYTSSRGDPSQTSRAIGRIRSSLVAFLIYIFTAAMLDFVIPAGFFK